MESIIRILMRRDGLSREEAQGMVDEVQEMINACIEDGDLAYAEDIVLDELGLEYEYLGAFLD